MVEMVILSPYCAVGVLKLNCFLPDFQLCRELFEQLLLLAVKLQIHHNYLQTTANLKTPLVQKAMIIHYEPVKSVNVSLNFDLISLVTFYIIPIILLL